MATIRNKIVYGEPAHRVPGHLCFGQYVLDRLREACQTKAEVVAMINGDTGEKHTYAQILQETVNIGSGLRKLGIKRGDVVALCSENRFEYIATVLGAVCCGATVTPFSTQYTKDEITHVLNISKPNIFIGSEDLLKANISTVKKLPYIKKIIQFDGTPVARGVLMYKDLLVTTNSQDFEAADVKGWVDTAYILYSSGTTGLPKGVELTHLNVLYSASGFEDKEPGTEDFVLLTIVPWYHAYGLMSTINYILSQRNFVYLVGFNPQKYLNAVQEYKVNVLVAVPPIVVFLGRSPLVTKYDLSSVFVVLCGAAPLSSETIDSALKNLPNCMGILQGYGMTETSLVATSVKGVEQNKSGCAGYPLRGTKVKVVDIESRKILGFNQSGEICVKGPHLMKGYSGNEGATRDMFDEEGYLKTGDIGYYDTDGCFFIIDRLKELIKYKGLQVAPAEVESTLLSLAGVAECAVVGAPDAATGEKAAAFVVLKPGADLSAKDIMQYVASKLSVAKHLHGGVYFVDSIPKNPSGKILRRVLRQQLRNKQKSKL